MSRPSQQMSNQQMSVSKCPVSKWKISKVPDTANKSLRRRSRQPSKNSWPDPRVRDQDEWVAGLKQTRRKSSLARPAGAYSETHWSYSSWFTYLKGQAVQTAKRQDHRGSLPTGFINHYITDYFLIQLLLHNPHFWKLYFPKSFKNDLQNHIKIRHLMQLLCFWKASRSDKWEWVLILVPKLAVLFYFKTEMRMSIH